MTVDAESDVIREGIRAISGVRDRVEAKAGRRIPIVWLVRFQRAWDEYVNNETPAHFEHPYGGGFDGFALAKNELLELRNRGDEIGWHYHAYNYVHRDDLSHGTRMRILEADLRTCAEAMRRRHPEFVAESFRFGWFFVPDYEIFETLREIGITRDASTGRHPEGAPVHGFQCTYLKPLASNPTELNGLALFPFEMTIAIHDWTVVPHDLGWASSSRPAAWARRRGFERKLAAAAARLAASGGAFHTYETYPRSMLVSPPAPPASV
jgi:hypothetical protein